MIRVRVFEPKHGKNVICDGYTIDFDSWDEALEYSFNTGYKIEKANKRKI